MTVSFLCPLCSRTSHHPADVAEGYCGACHAWTGAGRRSGAATAAEIDSLLSETAAPNEDGIDRGVAARYAPGRYPPNFARDLADQPMPPLFVRHANGSIG